MSRIEPTPEESQVLASLDKIIHEPGRLAIVSFLFVVQEADFIFLMDQTGLTRGNLSAHMTKLEKAGYVEVEKTFVEKTPRTTFKLTASGGENFRKYRAGILASLGDLPE